MSIIINVVIPALSNFCLGAVIGFLSTYYTAFTSQHKNDV